MDEGLLLFDRTEHAFAIVEDPDQRSRDPERFVWRSRLRKGTLLASPTTGKYSLRWGETLTLQSRTAKDNRSMELSELVQFDHRLLAMCDYTGLIFKVCYTAPLPGRCQAAARPLPGRCQAAVRLLPGRCQAAATAG